MANMRIDLLFDATTVSNNYNDGQEELHQAVHSAWKRFTGGFINSDSCDPPWYEGKGRGFDGHGGTPIARTFTTIAFLERDSATHILLRQVGLEQFLALFLNSSRTLRDVFDEKGITNIRLEGDV